jgi:hypothetical protein
MINNREQMNARVAQGSTAGALKEADMFSLNYNNLLINKYSPLTGWALPAWRAFNDENYIRSVCFKIIFIIGSTSRMYCQGAFIVNCKDDG